MKFKPKDRVTNLGINGTIIMVLIKEEGIEYQIRLDEDNEIIVYPERQLQLIEPKTNLDHAHLLINSETSLSIEEESEKYARKRHKLCIEMLGEEGIMIKNIIKYAKKDFVDAAKSESAKNYWYQIFKQENNGK